MRGRPGAARRRGHGARRRPRAEARRPARMACLPQLTGGRLFNTQNAEQIAAAVEEALKFASNDAGRIEPPASAKGAPQPSARPGAAIVPKPPTDAPPGLYLRSLLAQVAPVPAHRAGPRRCHRGARPAARRRARRGGPAIPWSAPPRQRRADVVERRYHLDVALRTALLRRCSTAQLLRFVVAYVSDVEVLQLASSPSQSWTIPTCRLPSPPWPSPPPTSPCRREPATSRRRTTCR